MGSVKGPGFWQFDLSVSRTFQIREMQKVEFRTEAFNLTNSVMFGQGNLNGASTTALNSASFGRLAPQAQSSAPGNSTTARVMQFALKYAF